MNFIDCIPPLSLLISAFIFTAFFLLLYNAFVLDFHFELDAYIIIYYSSFKIATCRMAFLVFWLHY